MQEMLDRWEAEKEREAEELDELIRLAGDGGPVARVVLKNYSRGIIGRAEALARLRADD